jgi:hypothetical protein
MSVKVPDAIRHISGDRGRPLDVLAVLILNRQRLVWTGKVVEQ